MRTHAQTRDRALVCQRPGRVGRRLTCSRPVPTDPVPRRVLCKNASCPAAFGRDRGGDPRLPTPQRLAGSAHACTDNCACSRQETLPKIGRSFVPIYAAPVCRPRAVAVHRYGPQKRLQRSRRSEEVCRGQKNTGCASCGPRRSALGGVAATGRGKRQKFESALREAGAGRAPG